MYEHNRAAKKHTIQRVKKRYDITWTFDDINTICGWIALKENAILLEKLDSNKFPNCEVWAIVWNNQLVKVVYDGKLGTLRTAFKTVRHYKKNFDILLEEIYVPEGED